MLLFLVNQISRRVSLFASINHLTRHPFLQFETVFLTRFTLKTVNSFFTLNSLRAMTHRRLHEGLVISHNCIILLGEEHYNTSNAEVYYWPCLRAMTIFLNCKTLVAWLWLVGNAVLILRLAVWLIFPNTLFNPLSTQMKWHLTT